MNNLPVPPMAELKQIVSVVGAGDMVSVLAGGNDTDTNGDRQHYARYALHSAGVAP